MGDHAEATLRYIRSSMDAASGVVTPGSAGILVGLVGVIAAVLAAGPWCSQWMMVWIVAAPVACVVGGAVMARQQRLHGRTLFGPSGRRFILCLAPALVVGAILTAAEFRDGDMRIVAATWLLLYGCAVSYRQRHHDSTGCLAGCSVHRPGNYRAADAHSYPQHAAGGGFRRIAPAIRCVPCPLELP